MPRHAATLHRVSSHTLQNLLCRTVSPEGGSHFFVAADGSGLSAAKFCKLKKLAHVGSVRTATLGSLGGLGAVDLDNGEVCSHASCTVFTGIECFAQGQKACQPDAAGNIGAALLLLLARLLLRK